MFGMGMPEILLILAIALIVIGPKKLPDLAKSMGRAMREFKKATSELKESMEIDTELGDVKKAFNDMGQDLKDAADITGSYKPSSSEKAASEKPEPEKPPAGPETPAAERPTAEDPPASETAGEERPKHNG